LDAIPGSEVDPVILYILGHAAPDLLQVGSGLISDQEIARKIRESRGGAATLLIWDVCFAKTFLDTSPPGYLPPRCVHLFACQSYERTWKKNRNTNVSNFSDALWQVLEQYRSIPGKLEWNNLTYALNSVLRGLQIAEIADPSAVTVALFRNQLFDMPDATLKQIQRAAT
jgi:hypothetical protein